MENFGEKSEKNILEAIEFLKDQGRFLISEALMVADKIIRIKKTERSRKNFFGWFFKAEKRNNWLLIFWSLLKKIIPMALKK